MAHFPPLSFPGGPALLAPTADAVLRSRQGAGAGSIVPQDLSAVLARRLAAGVYPRVEDFAPLRTGPRMAPYLVDADRQLWTRRVAAGEWDFFLGIPAEWGQSSGSGGGAYLTESQYASGLATHLGVVRVNGGGTVGGYVHLATHATGFWLNAPTGWELEILGSAVGTTTGGKLRFGWGDGTGGADNTDGAYVEFDQTAHATRAYTATAAAGTRTKTQSTTNLTFNAYTRWRIRWLSATSVEFWQDGTLLGTNTTNLPTASGQDTGLQVFAYNGVLNGFLGLDVDLVRLWAPLGR